MEYNCYLQDLSGLVPLKAGKEIAVHVVAHLDKSFEYTDIDRVFKLPLPEYGAKQDAFMKVNKNNRNENWTVGVRVYNDGYDVKYQSFFWLEGPPSGNGSINSDPDSYQAAGPIIRYDKNSPTGATSRATIKKYSWLVCDAAPVQVDFSQNVNTGIISPRPLSLKTAIAARDEAKNETDEPITKTLTLVYAKKQVATTEISDTHSFNVGVTLTWEGGVNWFAIEAKFSAAVSLEYGYEHNTTSTTMDETNYTYTQQVPVTVPPNESRYMSLQIQQDSNATADVTLTIKLKGKVGGTVLSGDDLLKIAKFMDQNTVVGGKGSDYLVYTLQGIVNANIIFDGKTIVSETPFVAN